jgi:LPXTG-site transpeptidase (sortase) family protein
VTVSIRTAAVALWRDRRRWLLPGVSALVALAVTGTGWWAATVGPLAGLRQGRPSTWHGVDQASVDSATAPEPTRLRIPKIGVDSPLDPLGLDAEGALEVPTNYDHAGWYTDGTPPGEQGPSVIVGHVDSERAPAVFYRLYQLEAGDLIEVARGEEWVRFRVASSAWYPKAHFPTALVYGPTPDAQLRLITCGGQFDPARRSYLDNLVVFAVEA